MAHNRMPRRRSPGILCAIAAMVIGVASPVPSASAAPGDARPSLPSVSELQEKAANTKGFTGKWFVQMRGEPTIKGGAASAIAKQQSDFQNSVSSKVQVTGSYSRIWNGVTVKAADDGLAEIHRNKAVVGIFPVLEVERPEVKVDRSAKPDMFTARSISGVGYAQQELGLSGKGVKIGVIDTGVDIDHRAFGGNGVSDPNHVFPTKKVVAGWDFVGDAFNGSFTSDKYNPNPTPDAVPDDCASAGHGTHVAGIAAGNDPSTGFKGAAPDALLGAYRVFGCEGSTSTDIMLAAMERAAKDGMDVVNMSIGASFMTWPNYPTAVGASAMADAGIVVTCSEGNNGASGVFSGSAPGVSDKAIATGSVDNTGVRSRGFRLADGTDVAYSPVGSTPNAPTSGSIELAAYPEGRKTGAVDLDGKPFAGKAVLVSRGSSTFYEKVKAAQEDGASAVLIYNNVEGTISGEASGKPPVTIPAVSISKADGEKLEAAVAKGATSITWLDGEPIVSHDPNGGAISAFSSYGPSATLSLKPDVLAPGGNIYSAYPLDSPAANQGYATASGTSMAAPHVAGSAALLLQSNRSLAPADVRTVLQNSAKPLALHNPEEYGVPASAKAREPVHRQGAGLIDVSRAVSQASSYAKAGSGELASTTTPSKISLGDTDSKKPVALKITNRSSQDVTYKLSSETDAVGTWGPNQFPQAVAGLDTKVSFSSSEVTVPANSTRTVDVTVTPPSTYTDYRSGKGVRKKLPHATMYGGHVVMTGSNHQVQRIPFSGLNADYESLPFIRSAWTYGDVYSADLLAANNIPPSKRFYIEPSLGVLATCPNGRVVGTECADKSATYAQVLSADHAYTMTGTDFPRLLLHFENPASHLDIRVYRAKDDGSKGEPAGPDNYVHTSDAVGVDTSFNQFAWDGTVKKTADAKEPTPVADGRYVLEATITKGVGKAQDGENTEVFTSKPFVVRRTATPQPGPSTAVFYSGWTAASRIGETSGLPDGKPLAGDLDGQGKQTLIFHKGNTFTYTTAEGPKSFVFGRDGDVPLVGDWDGDGKDTVAVKRGNEILVKNSLSGGDPDAVFRYGQAADTPFAGDWDGDGKDTVAVKRGNEFLVKNSLSGGPADLAFKYGRADDTAIAGDWNGDGKDTVGVRRGNVYHLTDALKGGVSTDVRTFGQASDVVAFGDWDGNKSDTPAVVTTK